MTDTPDRGKAQAQYTETFLDSVMDGVDRLQEDGGVAPEIEHHRPPQVPPPSPRFLQRRTNAE